MLVTGRKLPIGIQTFEDIRNDGYLYVDKTALMWTMANIGKPFFLSRPRRFGKSLLISTFEAYFKGRRDLFTGLAVEQLEKKWEEYPVLHLDLNAEKYDSPDRLDAILSNQLTQWEAIYGRGEDETTLSSRFLGVIRRASEQAGRGVVVLVDDMMTKTGKCEICGTEFVYAPNRRYCNACAHKRSVASTKAALKRRNERLKQEVSKPQEIGRASCRERV